MRDRIPDTAATGLGSVGAAFYMLHGGSSSLPNLPQALIFWHNIIMTNSDGAAPEAQSAADCSDCSSHNVFSFCILGYRSIPGSSVAPRMLVTVDVLVATFEVGREMAWHWLQQLTQAGLPSVTYGSAQYPRHTQTAKVG